MKSLFPEYFYTLGYIKRFIRDNYAKLELTLLGDILLALFIFSMFFFIGLAVISCEKREEYYYRDINLRVVSINGECSLTDDKFHKPQLCNTILFETLTLPKQFMEVNTCDKAAAIHIDTPWLYNHIPGDTVHFDYLVKTRFFQIRER